jgi:hypothetical protein
MEVEKVLEVGDRGMELEKVPVVGDLHYPRLNYAMLFHK